MKKMIFILAFALPVLCFGQKENVKLGEKKEKGQTEDNNEQQRERKERQIEQREHQKEMMREMRSAFSEPDSFVYMELIAISRGKEEQEVSIIVTKSILESINDPVKVRELESIRSTRFSSLAEALNELNKIGFKYLDSYSVGMKEPILKVIMRMPLPNEKESRRR